MRKHDGRFAFLLTETEGGSDVFLRGRGLDLAMDGDRVQASVRRGCRGGAIDLSLARATQTPSHWRVTHWKKKRS